MQRLVSCFLVILFFSVPLSSTAKSISAGLAVAAIVLAVGFQDEKARRMGIHAFLLAMLLTCSLSILSYAGLLQGLFIEPDRVFRNHIMTGMMMSFATYLCVTLLLREQGGRVGLMDSLLSVFRVEL